MSYNTYPANSAEPRSNGSDSTFAPTRAVYVGTAGNLQVTMADGKSATFANVQSGSVLPISIKGITAAGTDADDILTLS